MPHTMQSRPPGLALTSGACVQVHVVAESEYVVPEGNTRKAENSRRTERCKEFPPRRQLREQFEKDVAAAPVSAQAA